MPEQIVYIVLAIVLGLVLAYVVVRVGSVAYFRSRLDYYRNLKGIINGDNNGKK